MSKINLLSKLKRYKFWEELTELSFIKKICLFGSRERNDSSDRSDIDLAIELFESQNTSKNWNIILDIIDNADTLLKIDCINITNGSLDNELIKNISKDVMVIFER